MTSQRKVRAGIAGVLLVVMIWPVTTHLLAIRRVAAYRAQVFAEGDMPQLSALEKAGSGGRTNLGNSDALLSALRNCTPNSFDLDLPRLQAVAPGRALVAWREDILPIGDCTNIWPHLEAALSPRGRDLIRLRQALESGPLVFDVDYRARSRIILPHIAQLNLTANVLYASGLLNLHQHQTAEGFEDLLALSRLAAYSGEELLLLSCFVRLALAGTACNGCWELLHAPGVSDTQLATLQQVWEEMEFTRQAEMAMQMEFSLVSDTFDLFRSDTAKVTAGSPGTVEFLVMVKRILQNPLTEFQSVSHPYAGYWKWKLWQSYDDELACLKKARIILGAVRKIAKGEPVVRVLQTTESLEEERRAAHPNAGHSKFGNWAATVDGDLFCRRLANAEIQRRVLLTAIAIRRYEISVGRLPMSLDELAPLTKLHLIDPMDGKPLRYLPNPGTREYLLYSIGEDGKDEGGDMFPKDPGTSAQRYWLLARDAVWPMPASAEEVQKLREAEAKLRRPSGEDRRAQDAFNQTRERFLRKFGIQVVPPVSDTNVGRGISTN